MHEVTPKLVAMAVSIVKTMFRILLQSCFLSVSILGTACRERHEGIHPHMETLTGIGKTEKPLPPHIVESYPKLSRLIAAMTVMENGIPMTEVNKDAILEGYRLAFPDACQALAEFLMECDEYKDW